MNLDQMRIFVRTQLDLDFTDLPDVLLNVYIQDGFDRTIAMEQRWPFYESLWTITVDTTGRVTMPPDVRVLEELIGPAGNVMQHVDYRFATEWFGSTPQVGTPQYWTQLNREIIVWPPPSTVRDMTGHGYRMSADWIATGASSPVDADTRLHIPICWYACSLGYAQQEDEVLEATYLNRFKDSSAIAREAVMRPWSGQPRQAFSTPYRSRRRNGARFGWGLPAGPGGVSVG